MHQVGVVAELVHNLGMAGMVENPQLGML